MPRGDKLRRITLAFVTSLLAIGSGVALLWPLSDRSFNLPHGSYVAAVAVAIAIVAARCWLRRGGSLQGVNVNDSSQADTWRTERPRPQVHGRLIETVTRVLNQREFSRQRAADDETRQAHRDLSLD